MFLHFYLLCDILLQSEQAPEAEIHPQLNRAPSQAAESSPAKKVRPRGRCYCHGIMSPSPGLLVFVCKSLSWFLCPEVNVNDSGFLECRFFVKIRVLMILGPDLGATDSLHFPLQHPS